VHDLQLRVGAFLTGRDEHPFLREAFPLHDSVIHLLREALAIAPDEIPAGDLSSVDLETEHKPLIHLKGQLLASRGAIRILEREDWIPVLRKYLEVRREQVRGLPNEGVTPALLRETDGESPDLLTAFQQELDSLPAPERDPPIFLLTIGSQNQDRLSMLSNGEVLVAVSGTDALVSLTDFMFIVGTAAWPENPEELDEVFPQPKGWGLFFRRAFKYIKDLV